MERCSQKLLLGLSLVVLVAAPLPARQVSPAEPLEIAGILAARYPAQPIMSYIPALTWSGQLRLSAITADAKWREKAIRDIEAVTGGRIPAIAEPFRLTSLAGALAFADAASIAGDKNSGALAETVANRMIEGAGDAGVNFATGWTDDMFMASAVLSRTAKAEHADVVGRLLTSYAKKLQRPDGLFIHAENGPHSWGRGNGFALLGVTEALTHLPSSWAGRAEVLEIYRRHVAALAKHQSDDGSWRQVVDEPASYRELTVTAMTVAAIAR